jgi:TldD protein
MIVQDLKHYSEFFSEYTELRMQENRSLLLAFVNGNLMRNEKNTTSGVSARVYKSGSWGFSSNPDLNSNAIKSIIKEATGNATFLDSRIKKNTKPLPLEITSSQKDFSTKKSRLNQKELIDFTKIVDDYIHKKYPDLISRTVVLRNLDMEKSVITSDKSAFYSMIPRSIFYVVLTAEKDGKPVELFDVFGGLGQFEDNFNSPDNLFNKIDKQYEHLMNKKEGVFANAGLRECVLDSDLAGILAHEAIGHTTEADLVLGGSVAADYMDMEVASPLVSLVDFANTYKGKTCPVPTFVDDEGTKSEDAVIIENGILKSYMHNKESANHFNVKPTGNARAYQFSDEPLIRMRNTAILPGTGNLDEMISSIEDGYYLMKTNNGQADSTSEFMFGIPLGYEIKKGKLGRAIKDTTISGIAFDVLKTITAISGDMTWLCGGFCGKKQLITVGMGGPAIKCKVNIGGR